MAACALLWLTMTGAPADDAALTARSLVTLGDTTRLRAVLQRAAAERRLTLGVIGGSITQGAAASTPERRYGERLAAWCRANLPVDEVVFRNAGIGATGSIYGALRAERDLLRHEPDLVVVEYGVNDPNSEAAAETLEGLVRQILASPRRPAVIVLYTMHRDGGNAQEQQGRVAAHYGLPQVSFRDAVWPEIEAGRLEWEAVEADLVHPNDRGHELMAAFLANVVAQVRDTLPAGAPALPPPPPLPAPLLSDRYQRVTLLEAPDLRPVRNDGWRLEGDAWKADRPGAVIEFEVTGRVICLMEFHLRGPMGRARVTVDDRPPITVEAWFDQTWGGWRDTHELARDLAPGPHRVTVEVLEEKHAESDGHEFRVLGLGAADVG